MKSVKLVKERDDSVYEGHVVQLHIWHLRGVRLEQKLNSNLITFTLLCQRVGRLPHHFDRLVSILQNHS